MMKGKTLGRKRPKETTDALLWHLGVVKKRLIQDLLVLMHFVGTH